MSDVPAGWRRWLWFLRSRKVQTACVTVVMAMLADHGIVAGEALVAAIIAVGTAVILGIAVEDHGAKSSTPGGT